MNAIKRIAKYILLFIFGGISYYAIEMMYRGHSHWTMFLLGGLCFVAVGLINNVISWDMPIEIQGLVGAAIITGLEFIVGLIVNIILGWNVWDYSELPFNLLGQVCLYFTAIWYVLSLLIIVVDDWIRYFVFHERRPKYTSIFKRKRKNC